MSRIIPTWQQNGGESGLLTLRSFFFVQCDRQKKKKKGVSYLKKRDGTQSGNIITQAFVLLLYHHHLSRNYEPTMNLLNTTTRIFFLHQPKQSIITFSSLSSNAKLSLDSSRTNFQMPCLISGQSFRRPGKRFIVSNAASPSLSGSPGINSKHVKICSLLLYS